MAYYFQAKQLCVGYQNQPLIQNIEIELKKGEILTLIGPNGAGKSTILKSIARQLELLGGSVWLEEENLQKLSGRELAKKMAVVFTKRLHTELMTCEDVVATGRYPYTGRFGILSEKDHEAVLEAMEAVHVLELKNRMDEQTVLQVMQVLDAHGFGGAGMVEGAVSGFFDRGA